MPYLESGRGLRRIKRRRYLYHLLVLMLSNTYHYILEQFTTWTGEHEIKREWHKRKLEARYIWTEPMDKFDIEIAIHAGLTRLQGMLISGAYGDVYGDWLLPERMGSFEHTLTWGYGYLSYWDPYNSPYYFQTWNLDKVFLELNAELDFRDQEEYEMLRFNERIRRMLNQYGVSGSQRTPYYNYALELWRVTQDYDESEWASKIAELKTEGRAGALETTTYHNINMIILSRIESFVMPHL